jgi:hypothetical protein
MSFSVREGAERAERAERAEGAERERENEAGVDVVWFFF